MAEDKTSSEKHDSEGEKVTHHNAITDEHIICSLAHGLIIPLPVVAPLVIWALYKEKSEKIKLQSMQAMIYQLAAYGIFISIWIIGLVFSLVIIGFIFFPFAMILILAAIVYGLYAVYRCYNRQEFEYPVIGEYVRGIM